MPPPLEFSGFGIVRRYVAPDAKFGATVADQYLAGEYPRRTGNRVVLRIVDGQLGPDQLSRRRVERDQPSVERGDVDHAVPRREPARDDIATGHAAILERHLRIVVPQDAAGLAVVSGDHVPRLHIVEHPIDDEGTRFHPALGGDIGVPGETQCADGTVVDLRERAEALLIVSPA